MISFLPLRILNVGWPAARRALRRSVTCSEILGSRPAACDPDELERRMPRWIAERDEARRTEEAGTWRRRMLVSTGSHWHTSLRDAIISSRRPCFDRLCCFSGRPAKKISSRDDGSDGRLETGIKNFCRDHALSERYRREPHNLMHSRLHLQRWRYREPQTRVSNRKRVFYVYFPSSRPDWPHCLWQATGRLPNGKRSPRASLQMRILRSGS